MNSKSTTRKFTEFVDDGTVTEYVSKDYINVTRRARVCFITPKSGRLIGFIEEYEGIWTQATWDRYGNSSDLHGLFGKLHDLPVYHTKWINLYKRECGGILWGTQSNASLSAALDCIATIQITFHEGEGL
jgi:hypothetical protein